MHENDELTELDILEADSLEMTPTQSSTVRLEGPKSSATIQGALLPEVLFYHMENFLNFKISLSLS